MYFECFFTISPLSYQIFYRSTLNVNFARSYKISLILGMTSPCIICFQQKLVLKVHVFSDKNWKKKFGLDILDKFVSYPEIYFGFPGTIWWLRKPIFNFILNLKNQKNWIIFQIQKQNLFLSKCVIFVKKFFHPPPAAIPRKFGDNLNMSGDGHLHSSTYFKTIMVISLLNFLKSQKQIWKSAKKGHFPKIFTPPAEIHTF